MTAEIAGENAFEPRWLKDSTGQFQREHKQRYEPAVTHPKLLLHLGALWNRSAFHLSVVFCNEISSEVR